MKSIKIMILVTMIIILSSPFALAGDGRRTPPSGAMKVLDLLIIRPLSIPVSAASTGLFLGTLPITFTIGVSEYAARALVEAPWRFTNARCLGEFNHYKDCKPITDICEECCY
jgi:hypothetical protein